MNSLAEPLAQAFEQANAVAIDFVERLSETEWQTWCEREGRTVCVVVYHIAAGHALIGEQIEAIVRGASLPSPGAVTGRTADSFNAEQAQVHAQCTQPEALDLLERNGAQVAAMLRGLSDALLTQTMTVGERSMSLKERIERGLQAI